MPRDLRLGRRTAKKLIVAYHFHQSGGARNDRYDCTKCKKAGFYGRTCRKFFPVQENKSYSWTPLYTIKIGDKTKDARIGDVEIDECPVSYITPESMRILGMFATASAAKSMTEASLFGPRLLDWPAWAVDAAAAIGQARAQQEEAWNK